MRKTLSDIFDEATANEIENLVNQNTPPDVTADTLLAVRNKVYARTGIAKMKRFPAFHWKSYAAAAACLLLIVGTIFAAPPLRKLFSGVGPSAIVPHELPTDMDNILWAGDEASGVAPDHADAFVSWNGWSMDYALYEMLNRADSTDFIAIVVYKNSAADRDRFEYHGTTFEKLREERDELYLLANNLLAFHKEGEWLKYGELLYTTGTPDGEKWSKSFYDERVSCYGEDFIAKYIVDGKVQTALLNEDYIACQNRITEIAKKTEEFMQAYRESCVDDVEARFVRSGLCTIVRNGSVFLFVQKDDLAALNIDSKQDYMLSLAKRLSFEGSDANVPVTDDVVTGFHDGSDSF